MPNPWVRPSGLLSKNESQVSKAYAALTDEAARKNYEKCPARLNQTAGGGSNESFFACLGYFFW